MYSLGRAIHQLKIPTKYLKDGSFSFLNCKSTKLILVGQVHHLPTPNIRAHEFKWFYSRLLLLITVRVWETNGKVKNTTKKFLVTYHCHHSVELWCRCSLVPLGTCAVIKKKAEITLQFSSSISHNFFLYKRSNVFFQWFFPCFPLQPLTCLVCKLSVFVRMSGSIVYFMLLVHTYFVYNKYHNLPQNVTPLNNNQQNPSVSYTMVKDWAN